MLERMFEPSDRPVNLNRLVDRTRPSALATLKEAERLIVLGS